MCDLGKTSMKAVHKATGKLVVIKVLSREGTDYQTLEDSDETMLDERIMTSSSSLLGISELAELELERLIEPYRDSKRGSGRDDSLMQLSEYFMDH